jgi:hypothetical protein
MALTPSTTSAPFLRSNQITLDPPSDESNTANRDGVSDANDCMLLVNSVSLKRTRHSTALQHYMAIIAFCDSQNSAWVPVRPHVTRYSALLNGRITRHIRPYRMLYEANL